MRPEELQIGDIITYLDGTICKVREIREDTISVSWIDKDSKDWYTSPMSATLFNPVGLTSEILEKNGFELQRDKSEIGTLDTYWLGSELGGFHIHRLNNGDYQFGLAKIKFVHQLQNAIRLCGISKNIEI